VVAADFPPGAVLAVYFAMRYTTTARSLLGPFDPPLNYHLYSFPLKAMINHLSALPPSTSKLIYGPFVTLVAELYPSLVGSNPLVPLLPLLDGDDAEPALTLLREGLAKVKEDRWSIAEWSKVVDRYMGV